MSIHDSIRQLSIKSQGDQFSDDYRLNVYLTWYNAGKPSAERLLKMIASDPAYDQKPAVSTLSYWITEIFVPHSLEIDEQVASEVDKALVRQRVEMADRHAIIGRELQDLGLEYLRQEGIGNAKSALMAVIKGVEMERDARILPTDILTKLDRMTDEQLLDQFTELLQDGKLIDITPHHAEEQSTED